MGFRVAEPGRYTWRIGAGSARPAAGPLRIAGSTAPFAIQDVVTTPQSVTPNGDGQGDSTVVSYRLTASANVTVEVVDAAGISVATIVDRVWTRAGAHAATIDASPLPDGAYDVVVSARSPAGLELETIVPLLVSRTLGLVALTPSLFSPNGDGRNDRLAVSFSLTERRTSPSGSSATAAGSRARTRPATSPARTRSSGTAPASPVL